MKKVILGSDQIELLLKSIKGKRCGILTAASGVDSMGVPTYVKIHERGLLTVMFSPEHGIHSVMQDGLWSGEYIDKETGVPVFDLPSRGNPNIDYALSLCDIVIYDIQDVGARFYTYIYCLTYLMEKCAERDIPIYVLDRPNPISGSINKVSGGMLDETKYASSIGRYAIPTRYSLTCGEFACYINKVKNINCDLNIIRCENWKRDSFWDENGLLWINPSPNIPGVDCAINYIGTCLIEATNASEGRGTTRPFDIVGAPYVNSIKLCNDLNELKLEGVLFSRAFFTPMFGKWQGEACEGVQLNITDRRVYDPHLAGLHLLAALSEFDGFSWRKDGICLRYGNDALTSSDIFSPDAVYRAEQNDNQVYKENIKDYLIY